MAISDGIVLNGVVSDGIVLNGVVSDGIVLNALPPQEFIYRHLGCNRPFGQDYTVTPLPFRAIPSLGPWPFGLTGGSVTV